MHSDHRKCYTVTFSVPSSLSIPFHLSVCCTPLCALLLRAFSQKFSVDYTVFFRPQCSGSDLCIS